MPRVTVARLRTALHNHFPETKTDTVLRRLREFGLLRADSPGHDGVGSATVAPRHAALALLALCADVEPAAAPAEALRVGNFRLRALDHHTDRRWVDGEGLTFLDMLA